MAYRLYGCSVVDVFFMLYYVSNTSKWGHGGHATQTFGECFFSNYYVTSKIPVRWPGRVRGRVSAMVLRCH